MKLRYTRAFAILLAKLDGGPKSQIAAKLTQLADAAEVNHMPLRGALAGSYKIRVKDWRLIYVLQEDDVMIFTTLGHRSEVYE